MVFLRGAPGLVKRDVSKHPRRIKNFLEYILAARSSQFRKRQVTSDQLPVTRY